MMANLTKFTTIATITQKIKHSYSCINTLFIISNQPKKNYYLSANDPILPKFQRVVSPNYTSFVRNLKRHINN
jgi:hypothetical protein